MNTIKITAAQLDDILDAHALFLASNSHEGECANLAGVNLAGMNLAGVNLTQACLACADLTGTNLAGATLEQANLMGANMVGTNLAGACLYDANLTAATLDGANFMGADIRYVKCHRTVISATTQGFQYEGKNRDAIRIF